MAGVQDTIHPVIRTVNIKANSGQPRSFDPTVLAKKLEAARREQDAANTRRERRQATRNGTFVARTTTHSPDSSCKSPSTQTYAQRTSTMRTPHTSPPVAPQPQHIENTADGPTVMTHKSMFAALNLGLADLEAMTAKLERETSKQRDYLCSRCKTPDSPGRHDHPMDESRNYSRRRSIPAASRLVSNQHDSHAVYEPVDIPTYDPPQYHAISYRASEDSPRDHVQQPQAHHDTSNWTHHGDQVESRDSQYDVPSGYIFRRRNQQPVAASEVAAPRNIGVPAAPPPQEMHLISDAVKLIKAKERRAKRKSVVDFLKRL